ncbi:expansin-like protein [Heterostelium album PN500]|uniref:Expansin-like protein n=1 Tax=Heterostelium pallidum (strain ATCC 26659 / Pp 5 / PN500) TaxID=670386 RepID=D3BCI9_HETP5|nr:expansin-like protein [Heterostelium album PN500]EFA80631.1 expansin-like protein [Heterostelium album PN500]|eukprot:XP_020432751.1 expansin-like protein [Heterostelium album PN500]
MKFYFIFTILLCFKFLVVYSSSTPLTVCMSAKVQGTEPLTESGSCGYGKYDGLVNPGVYTATLNEMFYDSGARCGDCFEITGPNGTTTIKVVNFCSAKDCPSDRPFFMLTQNAFAKISSDSVVYDAGFRRVSCSSSGPLSVIQQNDTSDYYIKLLLFNNNVGISMVTIQGKGAKSSIAMQRQNSSEFSWTGQEKMSFPATVTATSIFGDKVSWVMSGVEKMKVFQFSGNFADKKVIKNPPETCTLSQTPATIYNDSLADGFNTFQSKSYSDLNTTDFSEHSAGSNSSLKITLVGINSYLSLSRQGEFNSDYFTGIKFSVKCNQPKWSGLKVFFSNDSTAWTPTEPITKDWSMHTVDFKSLGPHSTNVKSINFGNKVDGDVTLWFDDISFIVDPTKINNSTIINNLSPLNTTSTTIIPSTTTNNHPSTNSGTTTDINDEHSTTEEIVQFKNVSSFYNTLEESMVIPNNTFYPNITITYGKDSVVSNTILPEEVYNRIDLFSDLKEYHALQHSVTPGRDQSIEFKFSFPTADFFFIVFGNVYHLPLEIISPDVRFIHYKDGSIFKGKYHQQYSIWRPDSPLSSLLLQYNFEFFEKCSLETMFYALIYTKDCKLALDPVKVRGIVFEDLNNDGIRQDNERILTVHDHINMTIISKNIMKHSQHSNYISKVYNNIDNTEDTLNEKVISFNMDQLIPFCVKFAIIPSKDYHLGSKGVDNDIGESGYRCFTSTIYEFGNDKWIPISIGIVPKNNTSEK